MTAVSISSHPVRCAVLLPIYVVMQVLRHVLPLITVSINLPLVESMVPLSFKKANATTLLKKTILYEDVLKF